MNETTQAKATAKTALGWRNGLGRAISRPAAVRSAGVISVRLLG